MPEGSTVSSRNSWSQRRRKITSHRSCRDMRNDDAAYYLNGLSNQEGRQCAAPVQCLAAHAFRLSLVELLDETGGLDFVHQARVHECARIRGRGPGIARREIVEGGLHAFRSR